MDGRVMNAARANAPWRRGLPWYVIAIEGLVIGAIGIYIALDPDGTRNVVRMVIAWSLLIFSVQQMWSAFRGPLEPPVRFALLRAGVGMAAGLTVVLAPLRDGFPDSASRWVLGVCLIAYGVLALAGMALARQAGGFELSHLVAPALSLVVAVVLLSTTEDDTTGLRLLGWLALVTGVLLGAYAALLYRRQTRRTPAAAAGT
jgi:uncharacterized membrane protein HdeD (DUF308 family)